MPTPNQLQQWAQADAALFTGCGRMCGDCAFSKDTIPNNDPGTGQDIELCLYTEQDFYCHHTDKEGEEPVCSGFVYAKKYIGSSQLKTIKGK